MATTTTNIRPEFRSAFDRFFTGIGQGFNAYLESRSRIRQIEALNAKSDAELAAMGLSRDRIPAHVFSDLFYL
jgi:uncharacterized protein YjiS (DUF1127 family)